MNVKPVAYHWTNSRNVPAILEEGLKPSRGVEFTGVYLASDPMRYAGGFDGHLDACVGVVLRGLESHCIRYADRKWIISEDIIRPSNLFAVTDSFDPMTFPAELADAKERFRNDPRSKYPVRTELMKTFYAQ